MKSLALLVFLYLAMPGSGQMVWDGLPFSTRAEFAGLVLFVIVFFSQEIRRSISATLSRFHWGSGLRPLLVVLCAVKFLSFAWAPLGDGYGACYRSLYHPLEDPAACEKSYEYPLIQNHGSPAAKISRVENSVDYGKAPYDWSLPFVNEFPRLRYLWLDRLPFTATYSAKLAQVDSEKYLPVFGTGKISITSNDLQLVEASNYDSEYLAVARLPKGPNDLVIGYEYRDDETSEPEEAPEPRGPYARLKIGKPLSRSEVLDISRARVFSVMKGINRDSVATLSLTDRDGDIVETQDLRDSLRNAESTLGAVSLAIEFPAKALDSAPLTLTARDADAATELAVIRLDDSQGLSLAIDQTGGISQFGELSTVLWADRNSLKALKPGARSETPTLLRILQVLLDFFSLLIISALTFSLVKVLKSDLVISVLLGVLGWLLVEPLDSILPSFVGGGRELVIPYALLALLVISLKRQILTYPLAVLTPLAAMLSAQKVFEHLYYNHPGQGDDWWGKLIFLWRDSDWFANNGNARAIFVEGSLRGGESVYWFRVAPRYLIFAGHLLLGENDVLIAMISLAVGFMVVIYLGARFVSEPSLRFGRIFAVFITFIGLIFVGDQLIVAFGFFISSEYPTWLTLLALTAFLLRQGVESRVWVLASLSALVASTVQFRPNGIFVAFALVLLLLVRKTPRANPAQAIRQISFSFAAFVIVLLLSLIHNLYYGAEFVIFTPNPTKMYAFDLREVFVNEGLGGVLAKTWNQIASLMYWRWPNDPSYAIFFWGCQLLLAVSIFIRWRTKRGFRGQLAILILPLTYIIPMLPFTLSSYYPRLLVSASLLCLVSALLTWPTHTEKITSTK